MRATSISVYSTKKMSFSSGNLMAFERPYRESNARREKQEVESGEEHGQLDHDRAYGIRDHVEEVEGVQCVVGEQVDDVVRDAARHRRHEDRNQDESNADCEDSHGAVYLGR